jgi:hypothetical protein
MNNMNNIHVKVHEVRVNLMAAFFKKNPDGMHGHFGLPIAWSNFFSDQHVNISQSTEVSVKESNLFFKKV